MYANAPVADRVNQMIDLRSDTVSKPSEAMRQAMANAAVGDDVYGDDPTVNVLQEKTADLLGKEAGLFVPSGTQSNLIALMCHCGRGDEYIGGADYHISKYEAGGAAVLGSISPRHLKVADHGGLNPDDVLKAIQPDDQHFAVTKLVCLENTYNGKVVDQSNINAVAKIAHDNGLAIHLDGARIMNASIASGIAASELVANFDTVSLCLSKGLGAPVGSVLCGPRELIKRAERTRKMLGGGLRQAGVLAACGLYALDHNVERLALDHQNATAMAMRLNEIQGLSIDLASVQSNMIWMDVDVDGKQPLSEYMQARGILLSASGSQVRLVCHIDFDESDIDKVVDGFASWAK